MPDWNSQQWNEGEFNSAFVIITPRTAGSSSAACQLGSLRRIAPATAGSSSTAVAPVRRIQQSLGAAGASSIAAASVLRKPVWPVTVGTSASTAAYVLRKQIFPGTAGSSLAAMGIRRTINAALVVIGTLGSSAVFSKLILPAPVRGNMRVGPWTRPAFASDLRVHRRPAPA